MGIINEVLIAIGLMKGMAPVKGGTSTITDEWCDYCLRQCIIICFTL